MLHRFIAALIVVPIIGLFAFTVLLNPRASAPLQELSVISRTSGNEVLRADVFDNQVRISLKNNHKETITAFAISFGNTTIKEDFAYSDVDFGIEPEDTFTKSYPLSPTGSEPSHLYLLTVLLRNGTKDGNLKVAQQIKDERLGEKIEVLRTLRILEKEGQSVNDLRMIKNEIVAALNTDESETRILLNELQPTSRSDDKLSDDLKNGLRVGREKMLQRFAVLEQLPPEHQGAGFRDSQRAQLPTEGVAS